MSLADDRPELAGSAEAPAGRRDMLGAPRGEQVRLVTPPGRCAREVVTLPAAPYGARETRVPGRREGRS